MVWACPQYERGIPLKKPFQTGDRKEDERGFTWENIIEESLKPLK